MSTYSPAVECNLRVVDALLAGTHSGDPKGLEVIDATVADSIVCHGFPGRNPTDRASYKAFFRAFQGSFNDMKFRADQTVADEDFVAVRWSMQVSHVGEFAGVVERGSEGFEQDAQQRIRIALEAASAGCDVPGSSRFGATTSHGSGSSMPASASAAGSRTVGFTRGSSPDAPALPPEQAAPRQQSWH